MNNIAIKSDNLIFMKKLITNFENKIDVVLHDPPYNTSSKLTYNDTFSNWKEFITPRVKLEHQLLSETGISVYHIDEHEIKNLLTVMDNIYGKHNQLGIIIWNKMNPKGNSKGIAYMHEYIVVYAKNKNEFLKLPGACKRKKVGVDKVLNKASQLYKSIGKRKIPPELKKTARMFNIADKLNNDFAVTYDLDIINTVFRQWLNQQDFSGGLKAYNKIDDNGNVYRTVSMAAPDSGDKKGKLNDYDILHPITGKPCKKPRSGWRYSEISMLKLIENESVKFGKDHTTIPEKKQLLKDYMYENTPSIYNNAKSDITFLKSIGINFSYAKPVSVAQYLITSLHPCPKIVMDMYAGSGTTAHAVMELNKENNTDIRFIVCDITDIFIKRIKMVKNEK